MGRLKKITVEEALTIEIPNEVFITDGGNARITSLTFAEYFEVLHRDVLRLIRQKLELFPDMNERNLALVEYTDKKGEKRPMYLIDEEGFYVLAMGLTGDVATVFQRKFILQYQRLNKGFKELASELIKRQEENAELRRKLARNEGKSERLNFTAAVKSSCITDSINYGDFTNEEYRAIYNKNANALKDILSKIINKPKCKINLRDYFSEFDLIVIGQVEYITVTLLEGERGLTIEQIKKTIRDVGELVRKNKNRGNFLEPVFEQTPSNKIALEVKNSLPKQKKRVTIEKDNKGSESNQINLF